MNSEGSEAVRKRKLWGEFEKKGAPIIVRCWDLLWSISKMSRPRARRGASKPGEGKGEGEPRKAAYSSRLS